MRTPADPVALLSALLSEGDQRIAAGVLGGRDALAVAALVRAGVLVPEGVVDTAICDACGAPHLVEIVSTAHDRGYGWHCPEAGFVTAEPDQVAALSLKVERVVASLTAAFSNAFGARRWKSHELDGTDAWLIGVWQIGAAWTTVVLARGLASAAAVRRTAEALARLPQNDAGLILTGEEDAGLILMPRFAVVPLTASLLLDGEELSVAQNVLARAIAAQAGARLWVHAGRPGVEGKVFAVLDGLTARGFLGQINAGVVTRAWAEFYPCEQPPKASTLRKHISSWRSPHRPG